MGSSIGFQLARESDKRVLVLDERPPVGGISGRTFGQIRQHYSNELLVRMAMRGFDVIRHWRAEVGFGDPGYVRLGYLLLVIEEQLEALLANVALGERCGVDTRFVRPDEIAEIESLLETSDLAGGVFEPDGGYIDVTKMVLSWLAAALAHGADVRSGVRVEEVAISGGSVAGVATTAGFFEAPVVVVATGAWAKELCSPIGVDLPVELRRLDMTMLELPPGAPQLHSCITDGNSNVVLRPDMGRRVLAAAYPDEMPLVSDPLSVGSRSDELTHLERVDRALAARAPALRGGEVVHHIGGAYDATPDFHPILGWVPEVDGLCLATGFSGHGLKLSPAIGEIVAAIVLGLDPPFDVHELRATRFAEGDLMFCAYGPGARA